MFNIISAEKLTTQIKEEQKNKKALDGQFNLVSTLRLIVFFAGFAALAIGVWDGVSWLFIVGLMLAVAFALLLKRHNRIVEQLDFLACRIAALEQQQARLGDGWKDFEEQGEFALTDDYPQAKDLDLFGKSSLYQYLCEAHTLWGKQALADALRTVEPDVQLIEARQQAVAELAQNSEFVLKMKTLGRLFIKRMQKNDDAKMKSFLNYCEAAMPTFPRWLSLVALILPFLTVGCLFLAAFRLVPATVGIIGILLQFAIALVFSNRMGEVFAPLLAFRSGLKAYVEMFRALEQQKFASPHLQELQQKLQTNQGAVAGIGQLSTIVEGINLRFSPLVHLPAVGLLMWDFQCLRALQKWHKNYGQAMRGWLEALGELECCLSLNVITESKDVCTFPQIKRSAQPQLRMQQAYHPLLPQLSVVPNSLALTAQPCILTGSNMSGKTTFMRSIGVNLVLAYAGAPVCAQEFSAGTMAIFTSMRISDDVSAGISTFYAEILRIKAMVEYSKNEQPMIVLIDEIFKGTNSADRIIGATQAVLKLARPWCICLVSTHDFELCDLEKTAGINALNYHFAEHYVDDRIAFDYLLRQGRCETTNAQYLLHMAGII